MFKILEHKHICSAFKVKKLALFLSKILANWKRHKNDNTQNQYQTLNRIQCALLQIPKGYKAHEDTKFDTKDFTYNWSNNEKITNTNKITTLEQSAAVATDSLT